MIKLKSLLTINEELISESIYDRGIFKSIFFSGIPGSGKSYVISKVTDGNIEPKIVNTDTFIEYFSGKVGYDINSKNYGYFRDNVKKLTINQLALYINGMLPLFIDGTSNSAKNLFRREGIVKSFGYDTGMIWIETDVNDAIKRAEKRDRNVPKEFILQVYENLSKNKEYYKSHFKFFKEVRNSEGELTDKVILDAYRASSQFFKEKVDNPIGIENLEMASKSSGYLTPKVYSNISNIQKILSGWYSN